MVHAWNLYYNHNLTCGSLSSMFLLQCVCSYNQYWLLIIFILSAKQDCTFIFDFRYSKHDCDVYYHMADGISYYLCVAK